MNVFGENRFIKLEEDKYKKILDVGSGHMPHPQATHLCDKLTSDNIDRFGENLKIDKREFKSIKNKLPYKNKEFNYVICSHVLEHVDDPIFWLKELIRVGKEGFIDLPSSRYEKLMNFDCHKWFIRYNYNIFCNEHLLIFTRKAQKPRNLKNILISQTKKNFDFVQRHFDKNWNEYFIKFEWKPKQKFYIMICEQDSTYDEIIEVK